MSNYRQLMLHQDVYKELLQLDASVKAKFVAFQAKFGSDKNMHGLNFERLRSRHELYSARIDRNYRAIMMRVEGQSYLLLSVLPHDAAYDRIDERLSLRVRDKSGGLEVHDVRATADALFREPVAKPTRKPNEAGLLDWVTDQEFADLDLVGPIVGSIRLTRNESDLAVLLTHVDAYTSNVLLNLAAGVSVESVMEQFTSPVEADAPVDTADVAAALERPATTVVSSDKAVTAMLESDLAAWQVFLHPSQRRLVDRDYDGPARITGGPGSGKTVVALHRAARLAAELPDNGRILLTTFSVALAADLRDKLSKLIDAELMKRVEVLNVDKVARELVPEYKSGKAINSDTAKRMWQKVVAAAAETEFDAQFLNAEWEQVICGQLISTREQYFSARRHGRIIAVGRAQRARIWELAEQFTVLVDSQQHWTWDQLRRRAALKAETGVEKPYTHIIVDEAQDMTLAHWRLMRALVADGVNDMFIAGDAFQRIYGRTRPLSAAGIRVRGRASQLTMSYRVSEQHLNAAMKIIGDGAADDLDDGVASLDGFRSVISGPEPILISTEDRQAEQAAMVDQVQQWLSETPPESIAVCVPTNSLANETQRSLRKAKIKAELVQENVPSGPAVHVSTMHKMKGLEYRRVIVLGVGEDYPSQWVLDLAATDPQQHQQELLSARNLLFVAVTRARDALTIIWRGEPSGLLENAVKPG